MAHWTKYLPPACCSICCMVFSLFGVVGLLILSGLFKAGYKKSEGEAQWDESLETKAASTSYAAVGIYGGFIGVCFVLFLMKKFASPKQVDEDDE
ncbi:hypothetical protein CYY_009001 [Polysphondylium violaceum]|uniref:Transmembrane protein n=1 Tax=Polysphondylium violaceum TaxID=133409 RepID=A0A8J4PPL4_9MYCE|nr:hypothetical protein CYY_009001 [Polysphondylium violaceum]